MALEIIDGNPTFVVDLGFIDGEPAVFGLAHSQTVDLGHVDANLAVYGVQVDDTVDYVSLGYIDHEGDVYELQWYYVPTRSYRRIQLNGGGEILLEASVGDEPVERYFELWRNGRPFPLANVSNPIFSWKSPSGRVGQVAARIIDGKFGRIGAHLFVPSEVGTWLLQLKFVEEVNYERTPPDTEPPYAPSAGAQELWRNLPKALRFIVRDEDGWDQPVPD